MLAVSMIVERLQRPRSCGCGGAHSQKIQEAGLARIRGGGQAGTEGSTRPEGGEEGGGADSSAGEEGAEEGGEASQGGHRRFNRSRAD